MLNAISKQHVKSHSIGDFVFQPIVSGSDQLMNWCEMLYRPKNEKDHGFNAETFFSEMSRNEVIEFDNMVMMQIKEMSLVTHFDRISVNVSPHSLNDIDFLSKIKKIVESPDVPAKNICLEIVESSELDSLSESCVNTLKLFRRAGGWVALDDFGSGYAHWDLLKHDLVDVIKVVNQKINKGLSSELLITAISAFAEKLGVKTVIEGIESQEDFEAAKVNGFSHYQGYYFS